MRRKHSIEVFEGGGGSDYGYRVTSPDGVVVQECEGFAGRADALANASSAAFHFELGETRDERAETVVKACLEWAAEYKRQRLVRKAKDVFPLSQCGMSLEQLLVSEEFVRFQAKISFARLERAQNAVWRERFRDGHLSQTWENFVPKI